VFFAAPGTYAAWRAVQPSISSNCGIIDPDPCCDRSLSALLPLGRCYVTAANPQRGKPVSAEINIYNPEELGPPMGQYTHVTRVKANEFLFIAGMLSGDSAGNVIGEGDFDLQTRQVFRNIEAALKSAGASWGNVVQFTTYLVHSQDIPKFMEFRLREFPKMFPNGKYPPNTLLMVDRLVKEPFLVEVQTIAAV
jgi:enamine deaminase RidA (YjgF/YER057c/UK114 family)